MVVEVKKAMAIESIPIIVVMPDEELAVEVAMDMPDDIAMVAVADAEVDIVMPDMDMLSMFDEMRFVRVDS